MANSFCVFLCVCLCVQTVVCQFGFFPQRENRNNGFFGFMQGPNRIRDTLSGFFNPNRPNRPVINTDEQGNIYNPGNGNQYDYNNGQNSGRPVVFPNNNPVYNDNVNFQNPNNGDFQFQPTPDNGNFQQFPPPPDGGQLTNNGNGETNFNQDQPAQDGGANNGYQDENTQDNNVKPNEADNGVPAENDPVNFDDTPAEGTTLAPLTPVPVNTESRNNFNFQPNQVFAESCQTVEGGLGSCISVYQCQPYLNVLQESRTNPNAVQLLRRAHCGFEGNAPKVCCPRPGIPTNPPPVPTAATTTTTTPAPTPAPTQPTAAPKTSGDFLPALPDPPECGLSNASFSRVVGGVNAKLGDFPWMALLGYKSKRTGGTNWLCGGSLISSRHVLTAAHCIHNHEEDLYVVRLGELDLAREDEGATPVDILIKQKMKHEQYSSTAFTNDIGILLLEHDAPFTDLIRPICIPKDSQLRATTFEDYNPMIAGWGHTEFRGAAATHLQVLQLPVVSNEFCSQAYSAYKAQKIDQRVLCAGFKKGGKDACQGDSGGPLMQPIWSQDTYKTYFYQIGVVSYGKKCAEAGFPGVYSRVTHFVPWIEEKLLGHSTST
nr:venom serine protease Bi-VSP isoform X1 [Helicoverpa armigera]